MEHFKAAAVAADSKDMDPVLKYCAVGRQLGFAVYLSLDAVTYVRAIISINNGGELIVRIGSLTLLGSGLWRA